ncbi:ferredoxin [Neobacillus niacini]|uniref:2Fe-2S iron-sulfur cluster-binding protein n=1 Tax=Neobacillus niacini TaxID=86668 RepID=UPI0028554906|nr:2Fe-2S iron-sulfur cluster-binding protein [Neobacillus niacini]MDR7079956.1 ferredoxin [Neobacillus niacini]
MNNRVFTVGSLIPGRLMVKPASAPILTEKSQQVVREKSHQVEIIIEQNGSRFEIHPVKGKLLDAALSQGMAIQYKCRKGTCGQCAVTVLQGPGLSKPNEREFEKLKNKISNGYRLACQAEIV